MRLANMLGILAADIRDIIWYWILMKHVRDRLRGKETVWLSKLESTWRHTKHPQAFGHQYRGSNVDVRRAGALKIWEGGWNMPWLLFRRFRSSISFSVSNLIGNASRMGWKFRDLWSALFRLFFLTFHGKREPTARPPFQPPYGDMGRWYVHVLLHGHKNLQELWPLSSLLLEEILRKGQGTVPVNSGGWVWQVLEPGKADELMCHIKVTHAWREWSGMVNDFLSFGSTVE